MKNESELSDPLSRRSLLGRAVGAAGIMAALGRLEVLQGGMRKVRSSRLSRTRA